MPEIAADQTRVEWIDAAKGIGIIGVISVHAIVPVVNFYNTLISSFVIPLFFIMAGLTYKAERHRDNLKQFAISRGKQFLIPYFSLQIIMIGLFYVLPNAVETYLTPNDVVFWFFYGSGPPLQSTHLWFLPVLYFGFLLFAFLDRVLANSPRVARFIMIPILALSGEMIMRLFSPMLVPWHLGAILISCTFTLIGNELRKEGGVYSWKTESKIRDLLVFIIALVSLVLLSDLNGWTDIAVDNIGLSVIIYLGTGTIGTLVIFIMASYLTDLFTTLRDALVFLGNASQEIYEFHPLTFFLTIPILLALSWIVPGIVIALELVWVLKFSLALIITIPFVIYAIRRNRILAFLFTGRTKRIRAKTVTPLDVIEVTVPE